jgi:hypothetical protein
MLDMNKWSCSDIDISKDKLNSISMSKMMMNWYDSNKWNEYDSKG